MKKLILAVLIGAMFVTASCTQSTDKNSQSITIAFDSAQGCTPKSSTADAGKLTIIAHNKGDKSGELEILDGTKVKGEAENILPGAEKKFSITLDEGNYILYCGKKSAEKGELIVSPQS